MSLSILVVDDEPEALFRQQFRRELAAIMIGGTSGRATFAFGNSSSPLISGVLPKPNATRSTAARSVVVEPIDFSLLRREIADNACGLTGASRSGAPRIIGVALRRLTRDRGRH